jgi:hypothetical protein
MVGDHVDKLCTEENQVADVRLHVVKLVADKVVAGNQGRLPGVGESSHRRRPTLPTKFFQNLAPCFSSL